MSWVAVAPGGARTSDHCDVLALSASQQLYVCGPIAREHVGQIAGVPRAGEWSPSGLQAVVVTSNPSHLYVIGGEVGMPTIAQVSVAGQVRSAHWSLCGQRVAALVSSSEHQALVLFKFEHDALVLDAALSLRSLVARVNSVCWTKTGTIMLTLDGEFGVWEMAAHSEPMQRMASFGDQYFDLRGTPHGILCSVISPPYHPWVPARICAVLQGVSDNLLTLHLDPLTAIMTSNQVIWLADAGGSRRLFSGRGIPLTPSRIYVSSFAYANNGVTFCGIDAAGAVVGGRVSADNQNYSEWPVEAAPSRAVASEIVVRSGKGIEYEYLQLSRVGSEPRAWILYLHGGPYASFTVGYPSCATEWSLLMDNGFGVMACNPAGSRGYQNLSALLPLHEWAHRDLDGVEQLLTDNGDKHFKSAVGLSYGGLLAGHLLNRGRVKSAVLSRPLIDPLAAYRQGYMRPLIESARVNFDLPLEAQLPSRLEELKGEALVMHGTADQMVPFQHSAMAASRGENSSVYFADGQPHDLSAWSRNRLRDYQMRLVNFIGSS